MKKQNHFKRTIVCFLIISSIGFLTNCEKEEGFNAKLNEFINPMEFVGDVHNKGIEYIIKNFDYSQNPKELENQLCMLTSSYFSNYSENPIIYNPSVDYLDFGNDILGCIVNNDFKNLSKKPFVKKDKAQAYYEELTDIISKNINLESSLLFKKVHKLEYKIYNSSLPDEDIYLLLAICSVGKYSYQYWTEYLETANHKEYIPAIKGDLKEALINADISGTFVGAITGGILGAIYGSVIMPGVGTVSAAIAEAIHGGIWGAVIGSAFKLLEELTLDQ